MTVKDINASKVYIIILNYKKWQDVIECIKSILQSDYNNFTIIVIDNCSNNNSLEQIILWGEGKFFYSSSTPFNISQKDLLKPIFYKYFQEKDINSEIDLLSFPQLVFIQNEKNSGFAAGNNIGLRLLLKEDAYVLLLNPDMVIDKNLLKELIAFAQAHPFKSIIGAVTKSYSDPEKVLFYGGGRINFNSATVNMIEQKGDIGRIDYISGGAMFIHTKHLNDIGLLPENYFLYWEETDWCYHARQKGYQMYVCMTAICYDKISTTIGKSFLADYYYTRNGLLFISKYKKDKVHLALVFAFIRFAKRIVTGKWKRARGVYKGILTFLNQESRGNK